MKQLEVYNRAAEDVGNIVELGHVNVQISDQRLSTEFYVTALGLTRDPYLVTGTNNMWINVGRSQFHLPTGEAQLLRGVVGLVVPDLAELRTRLGAAQGALAATSFAFHDDGDAVEAFSPWGNRIRCHAPDPERFGPVNLSMAYVEFDVRPGTADGIARFYREIIESPAEVVSGPEGRAARVPVGQGQTFVFRETTAPEVPYDGHHVQVYLANFSGPYNKLRARNLISQESHRYQYRFVDIVDLDSGEVLFQIDHEVRSMTHPMYGRHLINRDTSSTQGNFHPGREQFAWSL